MTVLVIEAGPPSKLKELQTSIVLESLNAKKFQFDHLKLESVFSLPSAAWIALDSQEYEGLIVIGSIIGVGLYHQTLYSECARNIYDVAMQHSIALGFGILIGPSEKDILVDAVAITTEMIKSCIEIVRIADNYRIMSDGSEESSYQN